MVRQYIVTVITEPTKPPEIISIPGYKLYIFTDFTINIKRKSHDNKVIADNDYENMHNIKFYEDTETNKIDAIELSVKRDLIPLGPRNIELIPNQIKLLDKLPYPGGISVELTKITPASGGSRRNRRKTKTQRRSRRHRRRFTKR